MNIQVNLRHLESHEVKLQGELSVAELDIDARDEVIELRRPLEYDITVELVDGGLLARGSLGLPLHCYCVRCLKTFEHRLELDDWALHLPLEGDEAPPVVNDLVDLTPYVREDILLEFPQHPLCEQECRGLPLTSEGKLEEPNSTGHGEHGSSAWAELNKLKF